MSGRIRTTATAHYELFCEKLTDVAFQAIEFIKARGDRKPHLTDLVS